MEQTTQQGTYPDPALEGLRFADQTRFTETSCSNAVSNVRVDTTLNAERMGKEASEELRTSTTFVSFKQGKAGIMVLTPLAISKEAVSKADSEHPIRYAEIP